MKYRRFIVGESLGMIFSSLVILIGLAVFGENKSAEEMARPANITSTSVNHSTILPVSNLAVSLDETDDLSAEAEEIKVTL